MRKLRSTPPLGKGPLDVRRTGVANDTKGLGPTTVSGSEMLERNDASTFGTVVARGANDADPVGTPMDTPCPKLSE